ncbi:hypothetical protein Trydic_g17718 [Trypoxylus dichotomus]
MSHPNSSNISDRFYSEGDKRNFEDYIRRPPSFGDYGMNDRFGSEEDKNSGIVIFPDNPILNPAGVSKPDTEPKIEEKVVFPNNKSKVTATATN